MDQKKFRDEDPRFFRSRGLRLKLILSFSLLIIITTAIMFWLTYDSTSRLAADKTRHRINLLCNVFSNQINNEIEESRKTARLIAQDPRMKKLCVKPPRTDLFTDKFLTSLEHENSYFFSYCGGEGFRCINCSAKTEASTKVREIVSVIESEKNTRSSGTTLFRLPALAEDKNIIYVASSVTDDFGAFHGFIVLEKKLSTLNFSDIVQNLDIGPQGMDAYLITGNGTILAHQHHEEIGKNIFTAGMPLAVIKRTDPAHAANMVRPEFTFKNKGSEYIAASSIVNRELGWKIVIMQPYAEISAAVARVGQKILFVGIVALLSAFGLALYRAHRIIAPIGELLSALEEISRGEYSKRVKVRRRDEVGALALAFNRMTSTLEEKISALQDSQSQLREAFHQLQLDAKKRDETNRDLRRKVKEMTSISEITAAISMSLDLHTVLNTIVDLISNVMGFGRCSIKLHDKKSNTLLIRVCRGLDEEYTNRRPTRVGEGISGKVVKTREPIIIEDLDGDDRVPADHVLRTFGIKSLVAIPLITKNSVMGVLNIYTDDPHTFSEDEIRLLAILANQAASAIENARLYDDLRESYLNTIQALSMTIDAKDTYTHGHSKRVSEISVLVGNHMGMTPEELDLLKFAGDLHDIGKIGISELIIAKEGKLTVDEYEIVKTHPLVGETIIEPVPFLSDIKQVIRHHHERYDGYGYPDGLKSDEIPKMSRIILIADAYDAMTSDRPYRKALTHEMALSEIEKHSGTQFDPEVARAFLEIFGSSYTAAKNNGEEAAN